jgi:hypothetical protein
MGHEATEDGAHRLFLLTLLRQKTVSRGEVGDDDGVSTEDDGRNFLTVSADVRVVFFGTVRSSFVFGVSARASSCRSVGVAYDVVHVGERKEERERDRTLE